MTMKSLWPGIAGLVLVLITTSACSQPPSSSAQELATQPARIISADRVVNIGIEVARTEAQQRTGLMDRTSLADDAGMLFVYRSERPATSGFWMYQTLIPLDIAYLSADGEIRAIRSMVPCPPEETCPVYRAGQPFSAALEMNKGFFERYGVSVGDRVEWSF